MPRVILATLGSLGDLHPFIALGLALKRHGADVLVACAAEYQSKVEAAGLAFASMRPSFADMQRDLGMDRRQITDAVVAHSDFLFRELIVPSVRASYEDMYELIAGADMILTSSLCIGARMAAERRAIPWIGIVLQPLLFMSAYDPPVIPKAEWLTPLLRALGPGATRLALGAIKLALGAQLKPVSALRREIGLPPTSRNPVFEGQFGEEGAIGLYSTLLGQCRPDYPTPSAIVGFASFDSETGQVVTLDPELERFLGAGAAPVVFTLGSLVVNSPGSFYRESLAAARGLGKRAVLLVGETALADVHVCAYAPHSLLFPRAEAIVHQGGIGTLAQALRSGRPQLIVPFFGDQLDNASRAVNLGAARRIAPRRYTARSAARELSHLTMSGDYGRCAGAIRDRLVGENGAAEAARVILNRLESRVRRHGVSA
jgi:rhamnosyltransferase subunit B